MHGLVENFEELDIELKLEIFFNWFQLPDFKEASRLSLIMEINLIMKYV